MSVLLHAHFDTDPDKLESAFPLEAAIQIAHFPGLQFKIWATTNEKTYSGGFYLFETREAAEKWKEILPTRLAEKDGISNLGIDIYDIFESHSRITKAPLDLPASPSVKQ